MILDLGFGLLLGVLVNFVFQIKDWRVIALGVSSSLIVDVDAIIYYFLNGRKVDKYFYRHRDIFHHPFFVCLLASLILAFINPIYGLTWFIGSAYHFLHDCFEGWGIRFWPITNCYITFRNDSPKIIIADKQDQTDIVDVYGDANWARKKYGEFNWMFAFEMAVLMFGTMAAFSQFGDAELGFSVAMYELVLWSFWLIYLHITRLNKNLEKFKRDYSM